MRNDLAIVLTARMNSTRLPGKAMSEVGGKPLLYWIIERLKTIGNVVLSATTDVADEPMLAIADICQIPHVRSKAGDVVSAMNVALQLHYPKAKFVLRGLGDCPLMAGELIERMCEVMQKQRAEVFQWALAPSILPVYGSRESPYSRAAWQRIVMHATVREHIDTFYHEHRGTFRTVYHEPPDNVYFRPYRLEIDWLEDLQMFRAIADGISLRAPVTKIIKWLDNHQEVAMLNHMRVERTGPSCYTYETKRSWAHDMIGKGIVTWDDRVWYPPGDKAVPIMCKSGCCLLGYGDNGVLHTKDSQIVGEAYLKCQCGSGLHWQAV
mgnify:CR=1 FL=1